MFAESYYYRGPTFLYPLQSHPDYWFHVGKSKTKQAIMGLLGNTFCVVMFSDTGDLIEVQERPLVVSQSSSNQPDELEVLYGLVEREVAYFRNEMNLADELICVKRFRLPGRQIGINDLPDDLQEYAANRAAYSLSDDADLEEALQGWIEESLFVFWWEASLYVDGEGEVTSS